MANTAKWDQLVNLKTDGVNDKEIVKQIKVSLKRLKILGNSSKNQTQPLIIDKGIHGRLRTVRTNTIFSATMPKMERKLQISVRKMAKYARNLRSSK